MNNDMFRFPRRDNHCRVAPRSGHETKGRMKKEPLCGIDCIRSIKVVCGNIDGMSKSGGGHSVGVVLDAGNMMLRQGFEITIR